MGDGDGTLRHLLRDTGDLGFSGELLRRLDVARTAEGWSIAAVIEREGGAVRCVFRDVQWIQMAGTWSSGLAIAEFFHRPVPEVLRETLPSLITHRDLYSLTVRGGSHLNLVALGIDVTPE
jgi:hypothetical protein